MKYLLIIAILGGALIGAFGDSVFSNPILSYPLSDEPVLVWDKADTIFKSGNKYYLVGVNNSGHYREMLSHIVIRESPILTDFNNATIAIPFKVGHEDKLESAIMQNINGSLYLYFVWLHGPFPDWHWRTYVMTADDPNNPIGNWSLPKPLFDTETKLFQVYGSVMEHNNQLYWVGIEYDFDLTDPASNMVIYKMKSPTEITEPGMVLGKESWKCFVECGIYRPHVTFNNGVNYVVYSQSHEKNTSLGYISIAEGQDPMNLESWIPPPDPVFSGNPDEDVYLVETATFTESPDGSQTWMVYHATDTPEVDGRFRPRIDQVRWNPVTGEPEFPVAHGYGVLQPVPSGQE